MKLGKKLINFFSISAFFIVSLISVSTASAIQVGTGSEKGVFYPLGQKICGIAAESFVDCVAPSTGGSIDNINAVKSGERETGLAMLKVAMDSGLPYKELQIGEGSFIVTNQAVAEKILGRVNGTEAAVYAAALKLASMERIVFITMGADSGETAVMKEQLANAGAPETALVTVEGQDAFLAEIKNRDNAFGYFGRVPLSDNGIFIAIDNEKLKLMGAFNPAFKVKGTKNMTVNVAGVEVKTPVMPIAIVYKDENNQDVQEVVKAAQGLVLEDLVTKKGRIAKWIAKIKKWTSQAKDMSADAVAGLSKKVTDLVQNI